MIRSFVGPQAQILIIIVTGSACNKAHIRAMFPVSPGEEDRGQHVWWGCLFQGVFLPSLSSYICTRSACAVKCCVWKLGSSHNKHSWKWSSPTFNLTIYTWPNFTLIFTVDKSHFLLYGKPDTQDWVPQACCVGLSACNHGYMKGKGEKVYLSSHVLSFKISPLHGTLDLSLSRASSIT